MKTYEMQGLKTGVILKKGNIEDEQSDVILNWCHQDLRSGPNSFYLIHKKAGPALFGSTIQYEESAKEMDCFMTNSGMLPCNVVLHSVMPHLGTMYIRAFMNLNLTLQAYKSENLCRTLSVYIPEEVDMCLKGIHTFLLNIGLESVTIMYKTEDELNKIKYFLEKREKKKNLWERIEAVMMMGLLKLGAMDYGLLKPLRSTLQKKSESTTNNSQENQ